jgi:hypothetical protein
VYNSGVYQEYSYSVKDPEDAPESFAKFAVRITLHSSDESKTPLIKNFRAVAVI